MKSKVIISLFETVRLSVSISLRNLYNSLNSIKEKTVNTSNNTKLRADTHNQQRPKWKQENKLEFLNNIDKSKINVLCNQIHDARVNINLVTKEMITDICNQISNIFMESDSLT